MTKVPNTFSELELAIAAARAELQVAQQAFQAKYEPLKKRWLELRAAELAKNPDSLQIALQYVDIQGENTTGYHYLKGLNLTRFADNGVSFQGSAWTKSNQFVVSVCMDYGADDAYIDRTVKELEAIVPFIEPGAIDSDEQNARQWRVFKIYGSDVRNLARTEKGDWAIFSSRYSRVNVRNRGTLREMLQIILLNWPFGRPDEPESDDEY